jgi:trimethylamine--corrinoid protein Co-methyltransferase
MRLRPSLSVAQVEVIHRNALRVLAEIGVRVEHAAVRERLADLGGQRDEQSERVRFAPALVERLIEEAHKTPMWEDRTHIAVGCGLGQSLYHDPQTNSLIEFDEHRLALYIALARSLPDIGGASLLGIPFNDSHIPRDLHPLAEKLYAWKYGADQGQSVQSTRLCQPVLDMFECHASYSGQALTDIVRVFGFMVSPLKLARSECERLLFFHQRGFTMTIGHLATQGGTAPVTIAGSLTLALAEQMFIFLLRRALALEAPFSLYASVSTIDMRRGGFCYGRPEQTVINALFADLARFYGCSCSGHTGLTDAKLPSAEAGAQKAVGALVTAMATGYGTIEAGLLGTDEICSPVQMLLDCDIALSLRALLSEPVIDDIECAFDEIKAVGINGNHVGTDFTVENFRRCLWQPEIWSAGNVATWLTSGGKADADLARERAVEFARHFEPKSFISTDEERDLRAIIQRARGT